MAITSEWLKRVAHEYGADLVGIGDVSLFEGTPKEHDPRFIAPAAKRIIGLGFKVLRGSLRGIEEGTQFYQYSEMGVVHIDEVFAPTVARRVACALEDAGYEGVPLRSEPDRGPQSESGTNPEHAPTVRLDAVPVAPGKPAPDVLVDFRQAAVICGLGEIGKGGFVLTKEFGPLQRFVFILTDAALDPDPVAVGGLCDGCEACMHACPGKAYREQVPEHFIVQGTEHAFIDVDPWQCASFYMGANPATNPFMSDILLEKSPFKSHALTGNVRFGENEFRPLKDFLESAYPGMRFGYNASICGRSCWRACLVQLERRDILTHKFMFPFRTKPEWELSR